VAKKTRQEKDLAHLRRKIEVLRAQNSERSHDYSPPPREVREESKPEKPAEPPIKSLEIKKVAPKFIKADLLKTIVLSLAALAVILLLYLLRNKIPFL
jgi:hypothetical protein